MFALLVFGYCVLLFTFQWNCIWIALDWIGILIWIGLECDGLDWIWIGVDLIVLDLIGLHWTVLDLIEV